MNFFKKKMLNKLIDKIQTEYNDLNFIKDLIGKLLIGNEVPLEDITHANDRLDYYIAQSEDLLKQGGVIHDNSSDSDI